MFNNISNVSIGGNITATAMLANVHIAKNQCYHRVNFNVDIPTIDKTKYRRTTVLLGDYHTCMSCSHCILGDLSRK